MNGNTPFEGESLRRHSLPTNPQEISSASGADKTAKPHTHKTSRSVLHIFKGHKEIKANRPLDETFPVRAKSMSSLKYLAITATLSPNFQQKYPALFTAISTFNESSNRKNLNELIKCLHALPKQERLTFRRLESEIRLQLLLLLDYSEEEVNLDSSGLKVLENLKVNFLISSHPSANALRLAIEELKKDPTSENYQGVLQAIAAYEPEMEHSESEGMFNLIDNLASMLDPLLLGNSLHIEELKNRFEHYQGRHLTAVEKVLSKAIKKYEKIPSFSAFKTVLEAYNEWRRDRAESRIEIQQLASYSICKRAFEEAQGGSNEGNANVQWLPKFFDLSQSLPLLKHGNRPPSQEILDIIEAVKTINSQKEKADKKKQFMQLYQAIEACMEKEPSEFLLFGGERLLKSLQKNIQTAVALSAIEGASKQSISLGEVNKAIQTYNCQRSLDTLHAVLTFLETWETKESNSEELQLGEFDRYYGKEIKLKVKELLTQGENSSDKPAVLPSLPLPSTHPPEVFARDMAIVNRADSGMIAYLMTFQNQGNLFSHTDIGFSGSPLPIQRDQFPGLKPEEADLVIESFRQQNLLEEHIDLKGEKQLFLKQGWEKFFREDTLDPKFDSKEKKRIFNICRGFSTPTYRYIVGMDLDATSQHAEGVRVTDQRVTSRLEKILLRRRKEISGGNFNVYAGAKPGAKSIVAGGYASLLLTREDKIRHVRHAFIDNFLTDFNPQSFVPNTEEPRYSVRVSKEGGKIRKEWVEDQESGQFVRIKNKDGKETYQRNPYVLNTEGKLHSLRSEIAEYLKTFERGHIIVNDDGSKEWIKDDKYGQCFKHRKETVESAYRDERPMYAALAGNYERVLSKGEEEWCGSAVIRTLHSAYAFEHMPGFDLILSSLCKEMEREGYERNQLFDQKGVEILAGLIDAYAERIVDSKEGAKYFRDMHPSIRMSPRCTPEMIHKFLMGQAPGLVNSMQRAWKVIRATPERNAHSNQREKMIGGIIQLPKAFGRLVLNVIAATIGTVVDTLFLAPHQAIQRRQEKMERQEEAGQKIRFKAVRLFGTAFYGFVKGGLIKRVGGQFLGIEDVVNSVKKTNRSAFV